MKGNGSRIGNVIRRLSLGVRSSKTSDIKNSGSGAVDDGEKLIEDDTDNTSLTSQGQDNRWVRKESNPAPPTIDIAQHYQQAAISTLDDESHLHNQTSTPIASVASPTVKSPKLTGPVSPITPGTNSGYHTLQSSSTSQMMPPVSFSKQPSISIPPVTQPQRKIPYRVTRPSGVIARATMDRKAQGRVITSGSQIGVFYRKEYDGCFWLRIKEGWIQEHMGSNSNERSVYVSRNPGQPASGKIISTCFKDSRGNEPRDSSETTLFTAIFKIDILYPDNLVMKLTRTFDQINAVQKALLKSSDSVTSKVVRSTNFHSDTEIDEDFMDDVNLLLMLIETTDDWLVEIVRSVNISRCKCKEYVEFLEPTDEDMKAMELELMADGGIGGAWKSAI
jgi:hypothetical protein